jgi:hypothetical protein
MLPSFDALPATEALDAALDGIEQRYGERTAAFVAVQIEYPRNLAGAASSFVVAKHEADPGQ